VPHRYLAKHEAEICNKCIDQYVKPTETVIIKHDTIKIEGVGETNDIYQMLLLECDSTGQVSIKQLYAAYDSLRISKGILNKVLTSFTVKNNRLYTNIKVLNDSICTLNKIIKITKTPIINRPVEVIYKTPLEAKIAICSLILLVLTLIFFSFRRFFS
jgi:hypothetical protein